MTSTQTPASSDYWRNAGVPAEGPTQVIPNGRSRSYAPTFPPAAPPAQSNWAAAPQPLQSAPPQWGPPMPPVPPMGPQWGVPTGPPSNGSKKWAIIASGVAVVATIVAVTVAVTAGGSDSGNNAAPSTTMTKAGAPPETKTAESDKDSSGGSSDDSEIATPAAASVLLTPKQMEDAIGGTIVVSGEGSKLSDSSDIIDNAKCLSAWGPIQRKSYAGSGYEELAGQSMEDSTDESRLLVQAAVSFPSAQSAESYLADAEQSWQDCAGVTVTVSGEGGKTLPVTFGTVNTGSAGVLTISQSGSGNWGCERALGSKGAVVVDVMACSRAADGDGAAMAEAMLAKVKGKSA